jgi:hypothetical protein
MSNETLEAKTEIVALNGMSPAELFASPDKIDEILARITEEAKRLPGDLDLSVTRNRSAITSTAFKVVRSKTFLDDIGKTLVADLKAQTTAIDGERRRVRTALDALRDEIRQPLETWEKQEQARKAGHETAIRTIRSFGQLLKPTAEAIQLDLDKAESIYKGRDWEEYYPDAFEAFKELTKLCQAELDKMALQAELQAERSKMLAEIEAERAKLKAERDEINRTKAEMAAANASSPVEPSPVVIEPEPTPTPTPTFTTNAKPKAYTELSESTFVQMAHAINALVAIINKNIHTLPTSDSQTIARAIELRQMALAEAKRSGIITEV